MRNQILDHSTLPAMLQVFPSMVENGPDEYVICKMDERGRIEYEVPGSYETPEQAEAAREALWAEMFG